MAAVAAMAAASHSSYERNPKKRPASDPPHMADDHSRPKIRAAKSSNQARYEAAMATWDPTKHCSYCRHLKHFTQFGTLVAKTHTTGKCRRKKADEDAARAPAAGAEPRGGECNTPAEVTEGKEYSLSTGLVHMSTSGDDETGPESGGTTTLVSSVKRQGSGGSLSATEEAGTPATQTEADLAGWLAPDEGRPDHAEFSDVIMAVGNVYVDTEYLTKTGKIGKVPVKLMFDNGAKRNLIKERVLDSLRKHKVWFSMEEEVINLVGFGGGPGMLCRNKVTCELSIEGGKPVRHTATVTPNSWGLEGTDDMDGLVGLPFMQGAKNRSIIFKMDEQLIQFPLIDDEGVSFQKAIPDVTEIEIVSQTAVCIPPNQAAIIRVKADVPDGEYLVEPQGMGHVPEYPVLASVVSVNQGKDISIVVVNDRDDPLLLAGEQNLGIVRMRRVDREEVTTIAEGPKGSSTMASAIGGLASLGMGKIVSEAGYEEEGELERFFELDPSVASQSEIVYDKARLHKVLEAIAHDPQIYTEAQNKELVSLISEFQDCFRLKEERLTVTNAITHQIDTGENNPVKVPARTVPIGARAAVEKESKALLQNGHIVPSTSPWQSVIVMVRKKKQGDAPQEWRLCVDMRSLNSVTKDSFFPLPNIDDIVSRAAASKYFSQLDLAQAYYQVPLSEESMEKTAFATHMGKFEFKVLPFGLKTAVACFQALMTQVFGDMLTKNLESFLDDLTGHTRTWKGHMVLLRQVFERCRKFNLKLNANKSRLVQSKVTALGHEITEGSVQPSFDKIQAVREFEVPTTKKQVRSFVGLCSYYRKFIGGFARICQPLHELTKEATKFEWGEEHQRAFEALKSALISSPVLRPPDMSKPFVLHTDSSDLAIGACLSQEQDQPGTYNPIAHFSRLLKKHEKNYLVSEKEGLALREAVVKFRPFIWGAKVKCFTDNSALTYLFKSDSDKSARVARWCLDLQPYNLQVLHTSGASNRVADGLSRLPSRSEAEPAIAILGNGTGDVLEKGGIMLVIFDRFSQQLIGAASATCPESPESKTMWSPEIVREALHRDEELRPLVEYLKTPRSSAASSSKLPTKFGKVEDMFLDNNILFTTKRLQGEVSPRELLVVPKSLRAAAMTLCHDHVLAGHGGVKQTLAKAKRHFFWPKMSSDIQNHVFNCTVCTNYMDRRDTWAPLGRYPIPQKPWDTVSMDLMQLPRTERGNRYLLVLVCHFSRFAVLEPIPDKKGETVGNAILDICKHYQFPKILLSDNGKEFRCAVVKKLAATFGTSQCFTAIHHPASNGLVESKNKRVLQVLRPTVEELGEEWDTCIPAV